MTDDIVAFIRAMVDEDERVARAVVEGIWMPDSAWASDLIDPLPSQRRDHPGYVPMITQADIEHIARHDPARVLREVEAHRELLDYCASELRDDATSEMHAVLLAHLAAVWSDHPDYRAEWAPTRD